MYFTRKQVGKEEPRKRVTRRATPVPEEGLCAEADSRGREGQSRQGDACIGMEFISQKAEQTEEGRGCEATAREGQWVWGDAMRDSEVRGPIVRCCPCLWESREVSCPEDRMLCPQT
jgi:hypothetical protein